MSTDELNGDYPLDWDSFVGQDIAKKQLRTAAKSARMRGAVMEHVLIASAEPGIGKTSLALLTAKELGAGENVKIVSGKIPVNQARIALAELEDGGVLIYDEIHMAVQGGKGNAEWMLNFLQDGVIMGPMGPEQQPKITVIGATTDVGRLPKTIIDRFGKKPDLAPYTDDEATHIALGKASKLFMGEVPFPSLQNCVQVAQAANNNPRVIGHVLSNLLDLTITSDCANYDRETKQYDIDEALNWMGLSPDGLDRLARRYLVALLRDFAGGAGERALADRLGEAGGLGHVEKVLMAKGLIAKTKQGRVLLKPGIARARDIEKNEEAA
jgi:Holliday junction DNA helicase RuvB